MKYKVNILYFNIRVPHPANLRVVLSVGVLVEGLPTEFTGMVLDFQVDPLRVHPQVSGPVGSGKRSGTELALQNSRS